MKKKKSRFEIVVVNEDGTTEPFAFKMTAQERAVIIARWQTMKDEIRAGQERAMKERQEDGVDWDEVGLKLEAWRRRTETQYIEELSAMRYFLEGENAAMPANTEQFFTWFFRVKLGKKPFVEVMKNPPNIVPADFREFSEYKAYLYKNGGAVGDIPPQSQARPETPEPPNLTFERLFKGTAERETAVKSVEGGNFDPSKRPHLRAFYEAAVTCKLIKDKRGKERHALPLIAVYFGGHCHGNAVYQVDSDKKMVDKLVRKMQK